MEHKVCNCAPYAPTILRIALGLLFLIPGISKLFNPAGIIGMLDGLGLPAAPVLGWIVILSEILFGLALLVGFELRYTVWPLVVILVVATLTVIIPSFGANPMAYINLLFHILGIAGLVSLYFSGPGEWAVKYKLK